MTFIASIFGWVVSRVAGFLIRAIAPEGSVCALPYRFVHVGAGATEDEIDGIKRVLGDKDDIVVVRVLDPRDSCRTET